LRSLPGLDRRPDPENLFLCRFDGFRIPNIYVDVVLTIDPVPGINRSIHLDPVGGCELGPGFVIFPALPSRFLGAPLDLGNLLFQAPRDLFHLLFDTVTDSRPDRLCIRRLDSRDLVSRGGRFEIVKSHSLAPVIRIWFKHLH